MAGEDGTDRDERAAERRRPPDPLVERRRPSPGTPPEAVMVLVGFLGDSDRSGARRLYFTPALDTYAEFAEEDVVEYVEVPPDRPPFLGEQATRVAIRRDAVVEYTRARVARAPDEFDLDVRLRRGPRSRRGRRRVRFTDPAGICGLPYTVIDPTCEPTCAHIEWTCATGCCEIEEHFPSDIEGAC